MLPERHLTPQQVEQMLARRNDFVQCLMCPQYSPYCLFHRRQLEQAPVEKVA